MALFVGIAFPFTVESKELPEAATDEELIKDSLIQLILTTKGERILRPELGCSANEFVFETNDELLKAFIRTTVANSIAQFETRVIVSDIDVQRDKSDGIYEDMVIVTVNYIVKTTQQADSVSVVVGPGQNVVASTA